MKKNANLRMLLAAFCLLFGISAVNAQSGNDDLIDAKLQHQVDQLEGYDAIKYQQTIAPLVKTQPETSFDAFETNAVALEATSGNILLGSSVADGFKTCGIQLGSGFTDVNAARDYGDELSLFPGVKSVVVDPLTNTVVITFKAGDEWNTLESLFNIKS